MAPEAGKKINRQEEPQFRQYLGTIISSFVLLGTIAFIAMGFWIISIVVEHTPTGADPTENLLKVLQTLFTAILPLFGTWIGTVLAFYYTKENLQAANQSVRDLVDKVTSAKKLEAIKAKDVMIPVEKLTYLEFKTTDDPAAFKLKEDFLDFLTRENIQRVILLNENKNARYVLHRSLIERFITLEFFKASGAPAEETTAADATAENVEAPEGVEQPAADAPAAPSVATFADLLKSEDDLIKGVIKDGIQFINIDATLAVAKSLINNKYCQDVFITKGGQSNEAVMGWITNKTIEENSLVE
ncbi:MAG TPA: hypothetical protein PLD84_05430 [Chitinophagales bacterium]|nr:hypothetical protein [Chitinophagales bacterium]